MAKIVITHKVEQVTRWQKFDEERRVNMSPFAKNIESFVDSNGGNAVAVSMTVTDEEAMQAFLQSETCSAIMQKHGVIQPVTVHHAHA